MASSSKKNLGSSHQEMSPPSTFLEEGIKKGLTLRDPFLGSGKKGEDP